MRGITMQTQEMMDILEKKEEEILKPHLEHICYDRFNTLPAYIFMLNKILPENDELINAFTELGITEKRIMAEYLLDKLKRMKGTAS